MYSWDHHNLCFHEPMILRRLLYSLHNSSNAGALANLLKILRGGIREVSNMFLCNDWGDFPNCLMHVTKYLCTKYQTIHWSLTKPCWSCCNLDSLILRFQIPFQQRLFSNLFWPRQMFITQLAGAPGGCGTSGQWNRWWFLSHQIAMANLQLTGWWFGTFFIFPYIGNNNTNWLIFFRGIETTNQNWIVEESDIMLQYFLPFFIPMISRCNIQFKMAGFYTS